MKAPVLFIGHGSPMHAIQNDTLTQHIEELLHYRQHPLASYAAPTPEHFYPLIYCLGASAQTDKLHIFNRHYEMASLSMTSFLWS
ncbi:class III extradiol ring-cleavage dioxygenase family protein [Basilea psittacipulmonis]|uniref:Extradiol ring-cleavage dioxygenase class III enzyme subunit B domain-containing protein n=1 Tax=Basilea psittacipulmonis DSM 24701 TaxID=1072685 RepID=A0A077DAP2_9BURK|nr:hypothetical protein [Basilea psittacipulmonis]AIL31965.1 hypothetical protein IX83_00265 [Basilea psittacipulmonis DSM 24701]